MDLTLFRFGELVEIGKTRKLTKEEEDEFMVFIRFAQAVIKDLNDLQLKEAGTIIND